MMLPDPQVLAVERAICRASVSVSRRWRMSLVPVTNSRRQAKLVSFQRVFEVDSGDPVRRACRPCLRGWGSVGDLRGGL
jgi:hypothetical protein